MKKFSTFFSKNSRSHLSILFILLTFNACKKEETNTTLAGIRIINASPTLATYYPFINGTNISSAALPFAGSTAYATYAAGLNTLKFTSENTAESLLTKSLNLPESSYSSFYLINRPGSLDGLMITDDLSLPATDKAYIRYINLSPDAPAMDLAKTGETTSLITNKAFKTASAFIAISPGTYIFDAKDNSTGIIKAVSGSNNFLAGYHYDIIFGGMLNPVTDTDRSASLNVLVIK